LEIDQIGLAGNAIEYQTAWDLQRELHREVVARNSPDTVLLLEHPSVYTAGRRTEAFERPTDGTPVVDVDRGGKITWHGPGQLIGYPILHLPSPMDFELETARIKGRSGVWVLDPIEDRKIAAIGVRVAQGVTMHGFALNCNNDLAWFDRIVPCGIRDAGVTTLSKELGIDISVTDVADRAEFHLHRVFGTLAQELSRNVSIDA
jgi:lipoyl(octanoyl) transferase